MNFQSSFNAMAWCTRFLGVPSQEEVPRGSSRFLEVLSSTKPETAHPFCDARGQSEGPRARRHYAGGQDNTSQEGDHHRGTPRLPGSGTHELLPHLASRGAEVLEHVITTQAAKATPPCVWSPTGPLSWTYSYTRVAVISVSNGASANLLERAEPMLG